MRAAFACSLSLVLAAACSDPPPKVDPPAAPTANDPAFHIGGVLGWYLVGNDLTPGGDTLDAQVTGPGGTDYVDAWIDGAPGIRFEQHGSTHTLSADISGLGVGDHEILFAANGSNTAFARLVFHKSHPLYVFVSTDWDFSDPSQRAMDFQDQMHAEHPEMRVTNFVGPYTFTDDAVVDDAREAAIVDWVKRERDDHDGEIGLHIHPYCNFVEYAGLTCDTADSMAYTVDNTGYTVGLWAYGQTDFATLLASADQLFMDAGLGKPVTFRAGGWTATIDTMRALADDGFVADTSANNWARMEEWQLVRNADLYQWNMANWSSIGDTSQPYYPNDGDILTGGDPTLPILEVPDNSIMVDYVTVAEMTEIFGENWDGATPLQAPETFMMGYHPSVNLSDENMMRVDGLLDLTDAHLASTGEGPVVYEVLKNMPAVFSR